MKLFPLLMACPATPQTVQDSEPSAHAALCADRPGAVFFQDASSGHVVEQSDFEGARTPALPGEWLLCEGDWTVDLLVTADDVHLVGLGRGLSVLRGGDEHGALSAEEVQGLELRSLTVAGADEVSDPALLRSGATLHESSATVVDVAFVGNHSPGMGGGLLLDGGTLELQDVEFRENGAVGGAALAIWPGTVTAERVDFLDNMAAVEGGAVALYTESTASIRDATFRGNVSGYGGALMSSRSDLRLEDSRFEDNTGDQGGALFFRSGTLSVRDSDFHDNQPDDLYDYGREEAWNLGAQASVDCDDEEGCQA